MFYPFLFSCFPESRQPLSIEPPPQTAINNTRLAYRAQCSNSN
jgi:hypothetical protein